MGLIYKRILLERSDYFQNFITPAYYHSSVTHASVAFKALPLYVLIHSKTFGQPSSQGPALPP